MASMVIPYRNRNAPAVEADKALRLFCQPAKERPSDYSRLAKRARFHFRHALCEERGGVRTYVLAPADAPKGTILLVHGWASEASFMAAIAEPLRRAGYRIVLLDLPAHGRSQGRQTTLADCARAAHRVAAAFGPLHAMVGHSLGGLISLWIAEGGPPLPSSVPVRKIVLLASPNRFLDLTREFGARLGLCVHGQLGFERRLSREGRRPIERFSAASLLQPLSAEILIAHSVDDERVHFGNAEAIAARARRARLLTLNGLSHAAVLYDPGVIRSVIGFLA
jgi:pimeloyl-ACP methyl ester carboxylesterase